MTTRNSIYALSDEIAGYRRALHENPGTAYEENFASDLVAEKLSEWGIQHERGIAVTGIVATIHGRTNTSGRSIGLRADMDALNITEEDNKPHKSKVPGKMHACGHDGHTATLLGAAKYLFENNNFDGIVHFIFQPAEEGHRGAHKMIEEGLFERFPCDAVYGLHNWPYMPLGTAAMRVGAIMASVDILHITVKGQGGHAAKPNCAIDPIVIGSQIVTALQTLVSRETSPIEPAVLSITYFNAGTGAHNIIPDDAKMTGTLRIYDEKLRQRLKRRIGEVARGIAQAMGAQVEYEFREVLDPTINEASQVAFCADVCKDMLGEQNVDDNVEPSMGGEDFGAMLMEVPGCYIWMGQGVAEDETSMHNQGLHTPRYDFNDSLTPLAIEYWVRIVEKALPLKP
ncbi:MAG: amidohydrolase [Micavibrio sp.]|nr:amidohydrolase [Micavibrio sp.]